MSPQLEIQLIVWPWYLWGLIWMSAFLAIEYFTDWLLKSILEAVPGIIAGPDFVSTARLSMDVYSTLALCEAPQSCLR